MGISRIIKNSTIVNWVMREIASADVYSNSLILKWIVRFAQKIVLFCQKKTVRMLWVFVMPMILGYIGWMYSWTYCLMFILLVLLFILIWRRPELGLVLLLFSFALTPKIHIGQINSVIVPIRIDDLLLAVIALSTLLKIALNRIDFRSTSLDMPILLFLGVVIFSTFRGFFIHTIDKPIINIFYVTKIIEYFLIFYLTVYNIKDERQVRICLWCIVGNCAILSIIGIWEHFHPLEVIGPTNYYRLYERGIFRSESNHFGGYFVFLLGIVWGFILFYPGIRRKIYWVAFLLLTLFPLLWTYSRQSYIALAGGVAAALLFTKNRRNLIITACILAGLLMVLSLTQSLVRDRILEIKDAVLSKDPFHSSFAFRLVKWKEALSSFAQFPVLGTGLGSRHRAFYESNQILILSELGIFGYVLFWLMLVMILKKGIYLFNNTKSNFIRALTAGFLAGFIGLILHSFACNTFMITRIAGPFWIVAGLLFSQSIKKAHS